MSHEIENNNGQDCVFVVGQPAWHGLGAVLDGPPTVKEGIEAAGLNWKVSKRPMVVASSSSEGDQIEIPNHVAIVRETDNKVLGVVGKDYSPLQNEDAFGWFQPFLDTGNATLESAGSLFGGRRIWVLAKIHGLAGEVISGDEIKSYILLSNGHDGTMSVKAGYTSVRVVCNNTLTMAHSDRNSSKLLKIRHKGNGQETLAKVQEIMDLQSRSFQATLEQYRALAACPISLATFKEYVRLIFAPKGGYDPNLDSEENERKILESKLTEIFDSGIGMDLPGVRGTAWAAYNAITEFLTHHRGRSQATRLNSLWWGDSSKLNIVALNAAVAIAKRL